MDSATLIFHAVETRTREKVARVNSGDFRGTHFSRSTKVMFSAISATRFAILDAMMVYGDI
jgi:hypothetical protein